MRQSQSSKYSATLTRRIHDRLVGMRQLCSCGFLIHAWTIDRGTICVHVVPFEFSALENTTHTDVEDDEQLRFLSIHTYLWHWLASELYKAMVIGLCTHMNYVCNSVQKLVP